MHAVVVAMAVWVCVAGAQVRVHASPEQLAQDGANLQPDGAQALERQLEQNPNDLEARTKLLGYYFYQWMRPGAEGARAARRRHILWIVENRPDSTAAGLYETAIDPRGHALADPETYEQVRELWLKRLEAPETHAAVLGNIAKFLQLNDRETAERALLRALQMEPRNGEWQWRLGFLYALGILGVDGLAFNGQPASVNPLERDGPFATKARKALETSTSPLMIAVAANVIARYGTMLAPAERQRVEHLVEAEKLYQRAMTLDPANPTWRQMLQQTQALKVQMQPSDPGAPRGRGRE